MVKNIIFEGNTCLDFSYIIFVAIHIIHPGLILLISKLWDNFSSNHTEKHVSIFLAQICIGMRETQRKIVRTKFWSAWGMFTYFIKNIHQNWLSHVTVTCIIYLEPSIKLLCTTWTTHWTTGSSVKTSMSRETLSKNATWFLGIPVVWHKFFIFLSNNNILNHLCFRTQMLQLLKFFGTPSHFPSSLYWVI